MDRRLNRWHFALLGLFVLVTATLAGTGLFFVGVNEGWAGEALQLESAMPAVPGLRVGTRVRVLGIPVGQVTAIEPPAQPGQPVVVRFWITDDQRKLVRADATTRLVRDGLVGERVLEIQPGSAGAPPVADGARLDSLVTPHWEDLLGKVNSIVENIQAGQGTVGRLVTNDDAYRSVQELTERAQQVLSTVEENYSSVKQNWILKRWMKDRYQLLVRPDARLQKRVFDEADLFGHGRAVLTSQGRQKLDGIARWIHAFDPVDSEVVVAGFAADEEDGRLAELVSRKQAEAVVSYLTDSGGAHKTGWFTRRSITAHGFGNLPPPEGEKPDVPPRRIEVLLFLK